MCVFDPPVNPEQSKSLNDESWQNVSQRYGIQLRIHLLIYGVVLLALIWVTVLAELRHLRWALLASLIVAVAFLALMVFWVPRRVRHTRYLLRELDLHMQTGLLWRRTTSVAINRVQHLELTQGPLERSLGLSRLIVYTAGGMRSDLVLPGLMSETAQCLKMQILESAQQEGTLFEKSAGELSEE